MHGFALKMKKMLVTLLAQILHSINFSSQAALPCQHCTEIENSKPRKLLKAIESYDIHVCVCKCVCQCTGVSRGVRACVCAVCACLCVHAHYACGT